MKQSRCEVPVDLVGYVRGLKRNGIYKMVIHSPYARYYRKNIEKRVLINQYKTFDGMIVRLSHFFRKTIRFEIITSENKYEYRADKFLRFKGMKYTALRYIKLEPFDKNRLPLYLDRATEGFKKVMERI